MKVSIAFDINDDLQSIERIADKYVKGDDSFLFIPSSRYPLESKLNLDKKIDVVSKQPYLPYKCVPCVVHLLLKHAYELTWDERDLFEYNPLLEDSKNLVEEYSLNDTDMAVIQSYFPDISVDDALVIEEEVRELFYKSGMFRQLASFKDNVFDVEHEDKLIILTVLGHIKELRYNELLENEDEGE